MSGGPAGNSSSSDSVYSWYECYSYDEDTGTFGRPSAGFLVLCITYSFEFLVGVPSNLWLITHILRQRSKVTGVPPADFFLLHLALTQQCFYLAVPIVFTNHFLWQSNHVLTFVTFLTSMAIVMKPLLLCLVCVERYMAVVRPLHYLRFKAHRYRWGCLGVSWCIYFLMTSLAVFKRSASTLSVVFVPVLVIGSFCSLSVLKTLKKTPPGDREVTEKRGTVLGGKGEMNSMKKKAFITISIIQAVLTLNYLPIIITLPMEGRVPAWTLKCQYRLLGIAAAASCSYVQPLLYLHRLGRLPCTKTPQNT